MLVKSIADIEEDSMEARIEVKDLLIQFNVSKVKVSAVQSSASRAGKVGKLQDSLVNLLVTAIESRPSQRLSSKAIHRTPCRVMRGSPLWKLTDDETVDTVRRSLDGYNVDVFNAVLYPDRQLCFFHRVTLSCVCGISGPV